MLIILDIGQTFSYFGQLYMAIKGSQNEKSSLVYIIIVDYIWKNVHQICYVNIVHTFSGPRLVWNSVITNKGIRKHMNKAGRFNPKLQNGTPNTIQLLN